MTKASAADAARKLAGAPVPTGDGAVRSAGGDAPAGSWLVFAPLPTSDIMIAAAEAFTNQGYHGASVRDIAELAGVTVPTLYYHHGNKQGLLVDLLNASMTDLVERSGWAVEQAGDDPLHRFVDAVDCTVRFMCHRQRIARLDPEARYLDEELRASYAGLRKRFEVQMLGLLEDGVAAGIFDVEHPVDVNRALLGAYQSIAIWYRADGELTPGQIAHRHVAFSLDAVRAVRCRADGLRRVEDRLAAAASR